MINHSGVKHIEVSLISRKILVRDIHFYEYHFLTTNKESLKMHRNIRLSHSQRPYMSCHRNSIDKMLISRSKLNLFTE